MKLNIFPCRLTLDVPVTDGETALAVAAANIVGSIVRTRFSSPELTELRAGFLKLRQSGALFEKPAAAIFPGLLVAACYSTGKTEFTGVPVQPVLERALARMGARLTREGDGLTVAGTGSLRGAAVDAAGDSAVTAYLIAAATAADGVTEIQNAAGGFIAYFFAAGGTGVVYDD